MTVSVIVPTLNEEKGIGATLDALFCLRGDVELIAVDGGSSDATVNVLRERRVNVICTAPGRGVQLHAGAFAAHGEVLWFVHADTFPPVDALDHMLEALQDPAVIGGNFALGFDGETRPASLLTRMYPHFRKLGLCYGDSGIFVRRAAYEGVGGFAPYPIFEDLDLVKRLKRSGRFVHLPCRLMTSSRRFEGRSFTWTFVRWAVMQMLYWGGVSPNALGRMYAPIRFRKMAGKGPIDNRPQVDNLPYK